MNRTEEIAAIESHISTHGVQQCRPGETFYGEDAVSLRQRITNSMRAGKKRKAAMRARARRAA